MKDTLISQAPLIWNELRFNAEHAVVREMAATPTDVLLVASLCKNGQRSEPRRLIRSLEPTVRKDSLIVLPSSIGLQFVRKLRMLRHSDYVRSEEHTSELQSRPHLVCRLLLDKKTQ